MTGPKRLAALAGAWTALVTALHFWLNVDWAVFLNQYQPEERRKLNVAYIPVT